MSLNTVAVLLNDHCSEFERDGGPLGKRISRAMQDWNRNSRSLEGWFGAGSVISRSHADYHQIVVVHGNTGCPIQEAEGLPYLALDAMAECLKRHGWRAGPPARKRKAAANA